MKGKVLKTIVTFMALFTMIFSQFGVLAAEIVNDVQEKAKAVIEISIDKYNNFDIQEKHGTLLQFNVKTGIEYNEGENYGAIKKTMTTIKVPEINGELPERVEVIAQSTKATNGLVDNIEGNYSYDKEKGNLQLIASNDGEEPYNNYDILARDEYEVICVYGENAYNGQNEERSIKIDAVVSEELYNNEIGNISKTSTFEQVVSENIGNIISSDIETQEIYDGYIKSNNINDTEYETLYNESMDILIGYKDIGEKIVLEQNNIWQNADGKDLNNVDNVIYKTTQINKKDMINVLGENGIIKIVSSDGTVLQEINKDTIEVQEGIIEVVYPENVEKIKLEFSTPVKEGIIRLENRKAIKASVTNLNAKKIVANQSISILDNQVIESLQKVSEIQNAKSDIYLEIDNNNLGNGSTNNVVLTATLRHDNNEYNLFRNPTLRITLPQEVEKVVLGDVSILYGNGLKVLESSVVDNSEGCKEIVIQLDGQQTSYNMESINNGTNVVIPANIVLKSDINTVQSTIKGTFTNEVISGNRYVKEDGSCEDIQVNIININNGEENTQEEILTPDANQTEDSQIQVTVPEETPKTGIDLKAYAQVGEKVLNNGDTIHTTEIIKYVVNVTNTTDTVMNNVTINCQIPENTVYGTVDIGSYLHAAYDYIENPDLKEYAFIAETLEPGQTKTGYYEVVVKDLEDGINEKIINNTIVASMNNEQYASVNLENKIIKSDLDVYLKSYIGRNEKNDFSYFIEVTNLTDKPINNVKIESSEFQKELNVLSVFYYMFDDRLNQEFGNFDNGKLEGVIPVINPNETIIIELKTEAYNFDDNVSEVPLKLSVKAYSDENDVYYSNENRRSAYPTYVTLNMSSDQEGKEVNYGDEITYKLEITNESKIRANAHVYDYLSEYLDPVSLEYEKYNIQTDDFNDTMYDIEEEANIAYTTEKISRDLSNVIEGKPNIDEYLEIPAGKTVTMTIKAIVKDTIETVQVSNYATAEKIEDKENVGIKTVTSNIVTFTLLDTYEDEVNTDDDNDNQGGENNPGGDVVVGSQTISGIAWIDANRDGKRDSSEDVIEGMTVSLYDSSTQTIAQNNQGQALKTRTDGNGAYSFNNVKNGNYWVVFEYDTNNYSLTAYQKNNISTTLNSDAITKDVYINGRKRTVGITDTLTIENNNLTNIDIGLVSNSKFDLKLDKYISQVTVKTPSGTKTYNYTNTQFAKVDIKAKEIAKSNITIKYNIVITNEGDTEGFVSEIVDYIPDGYTFNKSDNMTWSKNSSGDLVNTSLAGQFIEPGESKVVTLTLTRELEEDSTGSVVNVAEIGKSQNSNNLSDIDSTPGNKNPQEDDYSRVELLVSIETGVLTYTIGIILAISGIYYIGSLIIKKEIKFPRMLGITSITIIPALACILILAPVLSFIYIPLGIGITIVGILYTILVLNEIISNEISLKGNLKLYFNLIVISILLMIVSYIGIDSLINTISDNINNIFS